MREADDFIFGGGREGAVCYGQGVPDIGSRGALVSYGNRGRRMFFFAFSFLGGCRGPIAEYLERRLTVT